MGPLWFFMVHRRVGWIRPSRIFTLLGTLLVRTLIITILQDT
jgi:hypothetical protein